MSKRSIDKRKLAQYQKEIYNLGRSFAYAFRGFKFAVDNERNMRIHLTVALFVLEFSFLYGLRISQYVQLVTMFALVIAAEMVNTAIEALVNLKTQSYDHLARIAKDVAAGAVLVLAIASVIVAGLIFLDAQKLDTTLRFLLAHPPLILLAVLEAVVAVLFIFFWPERNAVKRRRK